MKAVKLVIVVVLVLILALSGCATDADYTQKTGVGNTPGITPGEENTPEHTHNKGDSLGPENDEDGGDPFSQMPEQDDIKVSVQESGAIAEYRIFYGIVKGGLTYYYELQVYEEGWDKFTFIIHRNEWSENGGILFNYDRIIKRDDTVKLLNAITDNDFWNIPSEQPDDMIWVDGVSISVEGYSDEKEHHISMMCPDEEYGIYKIAKAFSDYGEMVALDLIHIDY